MSTSERSEFFRCFGCEKELDATHEVKNHVLRYSRTMGPLLVGVLSKNIETELLDAMKTGRYTCEECLGNETKSG